MTEGSDEEGLKNGSTVRVAGMISSVKEKKTKRGDVMSFVTLDDHYGSVEILFFPKVWEEYRYRMRNDIPLVIQGRLSLRDEEPATIVAETVSELAEAVPQKLYLRISATQEHTIEKVLGLLKNAPGTLPVYLYYEKTKTTKLTTEEYWVTLSDTLLKELKGLLGDASVKPI